MNGNKAPCGGFEVNSGDFYFVEGKLYFNSAILDTYGFMQGYCATLIENVNESSSEDVWTMDKGDIRLASMNAINGVPVFVRIKSYNGVDNGTTKYTYSTGNLCYFEEGQKLIFSCPFSQSSIFGIKFYDVNINTGIATVTIKQLS